MNDECLICRAPLVYLKTGEEMTCAVCRRKENSRTRCANGHYVCNDCHMAGLDAILALCLKETSKNPIKIIEKMMALPFCHMHGPEHHVMVGAALLTAYRNAGGVISLEEALEEMISRGKTSPAGPAASGEPAARASAPACSSPSSPDPRLFHRNPLLCPI